MSNKTKAESATRTETFENRDEQGKILSYGFKIYKRDENPLIGEISREQMERLMRTYTKEGSDFSQQVTYNDMIDVFGKFSFNQFTDIIRAFQIQKANKPFAKHEIEEKDNESLAEEAYRIKKASLSKKIDAKKQRDVERLAKEVCTENLDLKQKLDLLENISKNISLEGAAQWQPVEVDSEQNMIIWLSDMHIGCKISNDCLYENTYDAAEVERRLHVIFDKIYNLANIYGGFKRLIVCNLGDSLDGQDNQTSRRDHYLPQNMNNNEQVEIFVKKMIDFMSALVQVKCKSLEYYAVSTSNHGGDMERWSQRLLAAELKALNIKATVYDKFIDGFTVEDVSYMICHGKDDKDMKKPLPVTINDKVEIFINQYMVEYNIPTFNPIYVKGDSHVSATTHAKNFTYKSVGCFLGNSQWTAANFGNTPAVCEYSLVDSNSDVMDGIIYLK